MENPCNTTLSARVSYVPMTITFVFCLFGSLSAAESPQLNQIETAPTAQQMYRSALIQERDLRTPGPLTTSQEDYIQAVSTFTRVSLEYPDGPYAAQALWQAAGLCLAAFEHWHNKSFLERGTMLLTKLQSEYSHHPISHRVPDRLALFKIVHSYRRLTGLSKTLVGETIRYTLELTDETTFTSEHLTEPTRLFFDLADTAIANNLSMTSFASDEKDDSMRVGRRSNNIARVVLDLPDRTNCTVFNLYEPFRIVADCHHPPPDASAANLPPSVDLDSLQPGERSDLPLTLPRQLGLGISRIVIDPGHGGRDPGASGNSLTESALTMDLAERVTTQLHDYGIEVVLTRQSDNFVPLEKRASLATQSNADLFLSLHVNASQRRDTRGIETYVLDFSDNNEAQMVAARENRQAAKTLSELDSYVRAITNSAKSSESDRLASYIQQHLVKTLRTVDHEIPDLGVKQAPFVVLVGTQVPSVLAEIGFLSNQKDAALLKTENFRNLIASAIVAAILQYRTDLQMAPHQFASHTQKN